MNSLESMKGIGPKTISLLNRLNIYTIEDMVNYYPYRFEILEKSNVRNSNQDDKVILDGIIESNPMIYFFNKKLMKDLLY